MAGNRTELRLQHTMVDDSTGEIWHEVEVVDRTRCIIGLSCEVHYWRHAPVKKRRVKDDNSNIQSHIQYEGDVVNGLDRKRR